MALAGRLMALHERLLAHYGPLHWWPAESLFQVVIGAVLTQNTAWSNVEKAFANLRAAAVLDRASMSALPVEDLKALIRPSGTFRIKARQLHALLDWLGDDWEGRLRHGSLEQTRTSLLAVHGIGEETADAILLYAAGRPTFVIDAYTRRILTRVGVRPLTGTYSGYRRLFMDHLPPDPALFNEYHAQFVQLGKDHCRAAPVCTGCPLKAVCETGTMEAGPR
ncbi:MAG: hypothetical protein EXR51_09560 [Dehalococcoidia bacterium]|nr:hypothetical protein [Dehalococcoidia bacterium]